MNRYKTLHYLFTFCIKDAILSRTQKKHLDAAVQTQHYKNQ